MEVNLRADYLCLLEHLFRSPADGVLLDVYVAGMSGVLNGDPTRPVVWAPEDTAGR